MKKYVLKILTKNDFNVFYNEKFDLIKKIINKNVNKLNINPLNYNTWCNIPTIRCEVSTYENAEKVYNKVIVNRWLINISILLKIINHKI